MDEEYPEFTGAIVFCPVCCSNIDAAKWGPQEHTCTSCDTEFSVDLKPEIVAEHAIVG